MEISRIRTWPNMFSCVKDFQVPLKFSAIRWGEVEEEEKKKQRYDLLYVPVTGFSNILRKKREERFVLHTDWKYSCLPKWYLLISETFASVI